MGPMWPETKGSTNEVAQNFGGFVGAAVQQTNTGANGYGDVDKYPPDDGWFRRLGSWRLHSLADEFSRFFL